MNNLIGKRFGQYEITALVGEGGMGTVYRARDSRLNRDVAVKVLSLDTAQSKQLLQRFIREANTVAGLDHPNIVNVYNVGIQDGVYYIVMRLLQGETLGSMIHRQRVLAPEQALRIVAQLTDALSYAHERHIIHRDIKPANIMLEANDRVTLMDFGIAKAPAAEKLTQVGQVIGTLEYMSPEQFAGESIDLRTDLYALGIVMYQMLSGGLPFSVQTLLATPDGRAYNTVPSPRQYNPRLSAEIEQVLLRCLARRPEHRYQSAAELVAAFRDAVVGASQTTLPPVNAIRSPAAIPTLKLVLPNGYEQPLRPGILHIGRTRENDLPLNDDQVSRHHAEIHCNAQGCVLVDMNSTNGTFLNGRQIQPRHAYPLAGGYQIRLGKRVILHVRPAPPLRPTPPPRPVIDAVNTTQKYHAGYTPLNIDTSAQTARPTTMLVHAVARLPNQKLAWGLVVLVIMAALGVWFGTPVIRKLDFVWYNFPFVALVGPIVYTALRRRWLTGIVHATLSFIGGLLLWQRVTYYSAEDYVPLLAACIISGGFMEIWLMLWPKIMGTPSGNQAWVYECAGLALMAMLGIALLYGIIDIQELSRWGQWIGSAILGAIGWFVGDMVHQYFILRQTQMA